MSPCVFSASHRLRVTLIHTRISVEGFLALAAVSLGVQLLRIPWFVGFRVHVVPFCRPRRLRLIPQRVYVGKLMG